MKLNAHRPWITPLVIGAFLLSAVTGVLMFFHIDMGLNKLAHEWLSWAMVIGVILHVLLNLPAFKRYFGQKIALTIMGVFGLALTLSFIGAAGVKKDPPFASSVRALAQAPLPVLAQVIGKTPQTLRIELQSAGLNPTSDQQTVRDLVGPDLRAQMNTLNRLVAQH